MYSFSPHKVHECHFIGTEAMVKVDKTLGATVKMTVCFWSNWMQSVMSFPLTMTHAQSFHLHFKLFCRDMHDLAWGKKNSGNSGVQNNPC